MADATATFALNLSGDMSAAEAAAGDLELMKTAISADIKELNALKRAMQDVNKGGEVDVATFRVMQDRAKELQSSIAKGQQDFVRLGGSFGSTANGMSAATAGLDATTKKALGPMGEQFERLGALKSVLGTSGLAAAGFAAAVVALAVVVVAAVAAIGQLVIEMAQFALASSDAALKSQIMLEGLTGSAGAAGELGNTIASVAGKVTVSSAKVQELATGLYKAGKRGAELEEALTAAALEADGLGKNASPELIARRMRSLDVQTMKFKDHLADIFSGPSTRKAVDGFLGSMKSVLEVFDTSTASGQALQSLVSVMLDPLFDAASAVGPFVKNMFRGMVVAALLVAIAVLRVKNALKDAFGGSDILGNVDTMNVAFYAGIVVLGLIVVALAAVAVAAGIVAVAFGVAALAVGLFLLPFAVGFLIVVAVAALVVAALAFVAYTGYQTLSALYDLAAGGVEAAGGLIDGLVGGITSGAGEVYEAIKGLAAGAVSTLMNALQMHSPSKIFGELGDTGIAGGLEQGVDKGSARVNSAVEGLVSIPSTPAMSAPKAAGAGGNVTVQLTFQGASAAEQTAQRSFVEQLCETIETGCHQAGIPLSLEVA